MTFGRVGLILSFMEKTRVIKKEDVEYLANLARLSLKEEEKEELTEQLSKIIEYVSQLSKIEAKVPVTGDIPITNVFREDKMENFKDVEEIISGAPEKKDDFFKVPRII